MQPRIRHALFIAGVLLGGIIVLRAGTAPTAENQVFQWSVSGMNQGWPDGSTSRGTLYLWIPETTRTLRGLVILATNVPEHRLAGHTAIRRACAENDLGLIWSVPTFWRFGKAAPAPGGEPVDVKALPGSDGIQAAFLERLLEQLAEKSGYAEVATVPWLPMGESGHLLMVCGLLDARPERCIAGICIKNPHEPRSNRSVPLLWTFGTAQEWGQTKQDPRTAWRDQALDYRKWAAMRAERDWPLSMVVEAGTGHFHCTDRMAEYFAIYIKAACRARLSSDGTPALKPVVLDRGVLAHLPVPGHEDPADLALLPHAGSLPELRKRAWFFDQATAREAQALSRADWTAATALPGFQAVEGCTVKPFSFNSVTEIEVHTSGRFSLRAEGLPAIPGGFIGAGEALAGAGVPAAIEWLCGPLVATGPSGFRIALDRTWKTGAASYLAAVLPAGEGRRVSVQPALVRILENQEGAPQTITFEAPADGVSPAQPVVLRATSDAGLPVEFFVVDGPAVIRDGRLEFTPVPPRARLPIEVTVAAWQWGRVEPPMVRTAPMVRRTFRIGTKNPDPKP